MDKDKDDDMLSPSEEDNDDDVVGDNTLPDDLEVLQDEDDESETFEDSPEASDKEDENKQEGGKSYESLRIKMNDQGVEIKELRKLNEELQAKVTSTESSRESLDELKPYKDWYDQYYPILNELYQDKAIRDRIEKGVKAKIFTPEDAEKIAEKKISEFKSQTAYEKQVDKWLVSHPDVKGDLAKKMYSYLEKHDLNPSAEILEMAYVFCTKDHIKRVGVKEHNIANKKKKDAMVGGGGTIAPSKPKDDVDNLFVEPASKFYPGS